MHINPNLLLIVCPHCHARHKVGTGYYFDAKNNICCESCKNIIMPKGNHGEQEVKKILDKKTGQSRSTATSNVHQSNFYQANHDDYDSYGEMYTNFMGPPVS